MKSVVEFRRFAAALLSGCIGLGLSACGSSSGGGTPASGPHLYVNNSTGNSVTIYAIDSLSGDTAPERTITGVDTGLSQPSGIAVDAQGHIYVANAGGASITIYAASSTGDAMPLATITGNTTQLQAPTGIAVDAGGDIYVADGHYVLVYQGSQAGDIAPKNTVTLPGNETATGVAVQTANGGTDIYVASSGDAVYGYHYADVTLPFISISGAQTQMANPGGLTIDADGNILVTNNPLLGGDSVTIYTASNLDATPATILSGNAAKLNAPKGIVGGENTTFYVANSGNDSITVYAKNTSGRIRLTATLSGANTGLSGPTAIAVGP